MNPADVASRYRVWQMEGFQDAKAGLEGLFDSSCIAVTNEALAVEMLVGDFVLIIDGIS